MARMIKMDGTGPIPLEIGGDKKWLCMCGLSQNKPLCDGGHKQCRGEEDGKTYVYDKDGVRSEVEE